MNRGLDADLAIALGGMKWVNNAGGNCRYIVPVEMEHGSPPADMALPLCGMWNPKTPTYSTDLNACHIAEQKIIEMGLGEKYAEALHAALYQVCRREEQWWLKLATASAEARCKTMLSVLEVLRKK